MRSYLDIAKQALQQNKEKFWARETGDTNYEFNEFNGNRPVCDGRLPPVNRRSNTGKESRRLIDHLAEPEAFERWLDWAMHRTDPSGDSHSTQLEG
jgi:hypothetical protein